jgi:uncharacterized protein YPO0396
MRNDALTLPGLEGIADESAEQFRLTLLQLKDWGTFGHAHRMAVHRDGQLLLGRSGSGKTTILDAHATLLAPRIWIDYNAAARETGEKKRDRNVEGYIRGAYNSGLSEDDPTTEYLRPSPAWSIIAETYENELGAVFTLAVVLWLKGANSGESRRYFVVPRAMDIRELSFVGEVVGAGDYETRDLKKRIARELPDAQMFDEYGPYGERLRTLFRIDSDQAIKLLVRTISARNVSDLNEFIRENMLDPPRAIETAKQAADSCGELFDAKAAIDLAGRQIEALRPVREHQRKRSALLAFSEELRAEDLFWDGFANERLLEVLEADQEEKEAELAELVLGEQGVSDLLDDKRGYLQQLKSRIENEGGQELRAQEEELRSLEKDRERSASSRKAFDTACREVGESSPADGAAFIALQRKAQVELARLGPEGEAFRALVAEIGENGAERKRHEEEVARLRAEIASYEGRSGNIAPELTRVRSELCAALGLKSSELPFAGELIDVRQDASGWRPAIELVLRKLATTMLVSERDHERIAEYLDTRRIGTKLSYLRMTAHRVNDHGLAGEEHHIVRKLDFKDCPQSAWLKGWIMDRHAYLCAEDRDEFHLAEKAVTKGGLVKENRYLHVKDDRSFGRREWSLGYSNAEKIEFLKDDLIRAASAYAGTQEAEKEIQQRLSTAQASLQSWTRIVEATWEAIDLASIMSRIDSIRQNIAIFRDQHIGIAELERQAEAARSELAALESRKMEMNKRQGAIEQDIRKIGETVDAIRNDPKPTDPVVHEKIRKRVEESAAAPTLLRLRRSPNRTDDLHKIRKEVLIDPRIAADKNAAEFGNKIVERLSGFRAAPENAATVSDIEGASLDRVDDYLSILDTLETEGLPGAKSRFHKYMREQTHNNFLQLASQIRNEKDEIASRIASVNIVLKKSVYDHHEGASTYVQLVDAERSIQDVTEFLRDIRSATSNTLVADEDEDLRQFGIIERVVQRIQSDESANKRWRELVLDVRQHKEFKVHEYARGKNGEDVLIQVLQGGAGKSGGQRQKLAATCLAAALRYQFGGEDMRLPLYSTIVIDEAFSKTDSEYTDTILETFKNFGFQMILSTPLKTINACMRHVRGGTIVTIDKSRKNSRLDELSYNLERKRLESPVGPRGSEGAAK